MSQRLRIRCEAEIDIADAAAWYEEQRSGLGHEFLDEISQCMSRIAEQPEMNPVLYRSTRRALTRRFPFGVFYCIEEEYIVVLAVMHGSRDPQRWKHRERE
jgi:plasmid stabilization system protein ParE